MPIDQSLKTTSRNSVIGITLLLVIVHIVPLTLGWYWGWPWAVGGLTIVGMGLSFCTLYPHSLVFGSSMRRFSVSTRSVILTIDDGPCADTEEILALLAEYRVKAVFFLIGERAAQRPEDVRRIIAAGHLVGNHTHTHPSHWYWAFPPWLQRRELRRCQKTLTEITGFTPVLFRAPVGMRNPYCNLIAAEFGLTVTGWQTRGFDGVKKPLHKIIAVLRRGLCPGAIILLHQGLPQSPVVLRQVLGMLAEDGWATTLPEEWLKTVPFAGIPPANC